MASTDTKDLSSGNGQQNGEHVDATATTNGDANGEAAGQEQADQIFKITVNLPHAPGKLELNVSSQEQVQDLRTAIIETPDTFQYSCFHLEHNGERINDFVELSDVKGLAQGSTITLHEDPYSEREARMHLLRVKELIGASGERVDPLYGLSAGCSLHDEITADLRTQSEDSKEAEARINEMAVAAENYDFNKTPSLEAILPKGLEGAPATIKALILSPFNPPPLYLRMKGHHMYLQFTTISGGFFSITSHVSGFWVNKSGSDKFDPMPKLDAKTASRSSLIRC